jgi:colanic acid/amylovoran biosynthesis glycosyltransferase
VTARRALPLARTILSAVNAEPVATGTSPSAPPAVGSRTAYVVSAYPAISHAFIQREVRAMRALGATVEVFSVHRALPSDLLSGVDAEEAAATSSILPIRVNDLLGAHLRAFLRSPRAYLATLRYAVSQAPRGARSRLWQLFYFAEALVLWARCEDRDLHHLHAHLANVAADVSWLAAHFGRMADRQGSWCWSFTMHGCVEFWEVDRFNLARKVAAADLVICISDFTRAQLMALCDPKHWSKLHVVHCGVELDRYQLQASAGSTEDPIQILAVGRLSHEKGHLMLLAAVAELRRRSLLAQLTVVGDGPLRSQLEAEAKRLEIEDVVAFVGSASQDEMPAFFARADIFCQPSFAEGIPVVLMEAMAVGLPVVSTSVAGIPELVAHGRSGLLVAPGRPDLLADALSGLVSSADARIAMGRAGRAIVEQDFDVVKCAERIADLFAGLARR